MSMQQVEHENFGQNNENYDSINNNNNNNRYRIACYSIELSASVDYMKPSFAIKSMNHCIFNRELDTG